MTVLIKASITLVVIFCLVLIFKIIYLNYQDGSLGNYFIEQQVRKDSYKISCKSGLCYVTYIWHNGDIIKSWYDDVDSMSPLLPNTRKKEAQLFIDKIKQ